MIELGDMLVVGTPPARLLKAMAVIADTLHQEFARAPWIDHPDKSKESCILSSLTVREFLNAIGLDAKVRPVWTYIRADKDGAMLHSVGLGAPGQEMQERRWVGHMVVECERYLIDTTLYPAIRPQWKDLSGMMAVPILDDVGSQQINGYDAVAMLSAATDCELLIAWLDTPTNTTWRHGPDATMHNRRRDVAKAMIKKFGTFT